ncbi:hypothetical protein FT641_20200 [Bacillus paranthracis]|uniref:hypothetical protein n=1 Tax=Bacillus paranthracis TaxID=2026186 RepID=UPI00187AE1C6|nr:hypothetical protein [Bacillus paranthracis]MBE7114615.1 hypothetical protein [Bacillus paranthracis]MBE7155018.1 hypothetical protein [Bacillus paranthracis]
MVTMQELRARQIKSSEEGITGHHIVVIQGLGGLTSHFLYNLMFRLENVSGGATVILVDGEGIGVTVRDEDIQTGLYIPSDRGKRYIDVLQNRYNGVFSVDMLEGSTGLLQEMSRGNDLGVNIFLIDFTKRGSADMLQAFDALSHVRRVSKNVHTLCNIRVYTNGDISHMNARLLSSEGKVRGERYPVNQDYEVGSGSDTFVRNQMLSIYVFNYINALVSEGMTVDYHALYGDMLQGEQGLTREFFEIPVLTIFDEYEVSVDAIPKEVLIAFREKWERCVGMVHETVFPDFMRNHSNMTGKRKRIDALRYMAKVIPILEDPVMSLETRKDENAALVIALKQLCVNATKANQELGKNKAAVMVKMEDEIKVGLTLLQYVKEEGVWLF